MRRRLPHHNAVACWLLLWCSVGACQSAPTTVVPTASSMVVAPSHQVAPGFDPVAAQVGIQATLDRYAAARNTRDMDALQRVVDTRNQRFWGLVQTRVRGANESLPQGSTVRYTVRAVTPRGLGLVHAQFAYTDSQRTDALVGDYMFRAVDGQWVLAEPLPTELTARVLETAHFRIETTTWADDINPTLARLAEQTHDRVVAILGAEAPSKARLIPLHIADYRINSLTQGGIHTRDDSTLLIVAPYSFAYGLYDPSAGWEADIERIIAHEYTHFLQQQRFIPIEKLPDWMAEGLAEYTSGHDQFADVAEALRAGQRIPIVDPANTNRDLNHLRTLQEDTWLGYGLSYALVRYIVSTHGGIAGFWQLADAYTQTGTLETAVPQAFGISFAAFDAAWQVWLMQTYGVPGTATP